MEDATKDVTLMSPQAGRLSRRLMLVGELAGYVAAAYLGYLGHTGAISIPTAIVAGIGTALATNFAGYALSYAVEKNAKVTVKMQEKDIPPGIAFSINEPERAPELPERTHEEKLQTQRQTALESSPQLRY